MYIKRETYLNRLIAKEVTMYIKRETYQNPPKDSQG